MKEKLIYVVSGIVMIILLVAGILLNGNRQPKNDYSFIQAKMSEIDGLIKITGSVKAAEDVDLAFEKSGKIDKIFVKVGDKVEAGQILAQQAASDISAQYNQALALVQSAKAALANARAGELAQEAKLDELKRGARIEDLQAAQVSVDNAAKTVNDAEANQSNVKAKAKVDLDNAYAKLADILNSAYTTSLDSVNNKTEDMFNDPLTDPKIKFITNNKDLQNVVEYTRGVINSDISLMKSALDGLGVDQASRNSTAEKFGDYLAAERKFLEQLNTLIDSGIGIESAKAGYKSEVNIALNNINSSITLLNNQEQAITAQKSLNDSLITAADAQLNQARNALSSAQEVLKIKQAGSSAEQIKAQEAVVEQAKAGVSAQQASIAQAEANAENYQVQIGKTTVTSPIKGVVSRQDGREGGIISMNMPFISLISDARFQIKANMPEAGLSRIEIGQNAVITLDAYGPEKRFSATVISIDPASTQVNGLPVYAVTLEFADNDPMIRAGMSADASIVISSKKDILTIPLSSVIRENDKTFVIKKGQAGENEKVEVRLGVSDKDSIEVISGINSGDQVAYFGK